MADIAIKTSENEKELLEIILRESQIRTVFQPIVSLRDGTLLGHEALSRPMCKDQSISIESLFMIASANNRLWKLELLCRSTALKTAFLNMNPSYAHQLFVNVNPNTMNDEHFKKGFTKNFLAHYDITPKSVIFEISEKTPITDLTNFQQTVRHYRDQGFEIAIDDVGSGFSGLNLISTVYPDYIKLDMNLIRDIDKDSLKYALVYSMVELSKTTDIQLIAEGIETYRELETLIQLGVQYGQGYYIQRPEPFIKGIKEELLADIQQINKQQRHTFQNSVSAYQIKYLRIPAEVISPHVKATDGYEYMRKNPACFGFCIVDHEIPVGILTREKMMQIMSGNYGFSLSRNKTIGDLMDCDFLAVESEMLIHEVSSMAMARTHDKLYDFIVVTEHQRYFGTVTIKVLLEKSMEIEIMVAKHSNPLTGLPGNLLIEQHLNECIAAKNDYSVAYFDIHHFKSYNDVYGIENGDRVISKLAELLKSYMPKGSFVGHVGGDDFVVILKKAVPFDYFKETVELFNKHAHHFYNQSDALNGFIITCGRDGKEGMFPLISLTCVIVNSKQKKFLTISEMTEYLAELKKDARSERHLS